jgi:hypothetical protein
MQSDAVPSNATRSLVWNGSIFCAVGQGGAATSPDGITWTAQSIPSVAGALRWLWSVVVWTGVLFVAVDYGTVGVSSAAVYTSRDGANWDAIGAAVPSSSSLGWRSLVWWGYGAVAVGQNAAATSATA